MSKSVLALAVALLLPIAARADAFDNYTKLILAKIPESKSAEKVVKLTPALMIEHSRALPGINSTFVVVKTNDNRYAKLLVRAGAQKISETESLPIVLIERFVTFRDGEDRAIYASGKDMRLFADFRLNLDVGQIVPASVTADVRFVVTKDGSFLEPIGKAEMFVVTAHLPEANPARPAKLEIGAKFERRYFNGDYKLYDDGHRSGTLHLTVAENGEVVGHYYSDKDGKKYEVSGKVSNAPLHKIEFFISLPQTTQTFVGYLFTGDGRAITGSSTLGGIVTGFYAVRIEGEKK